MRNADELHEVMCAAIDCGHFVRVSKDPLSPTTGTTLEAVPGQTFVLTRPLCNLVQRVPVDLRWAKANILHFFTGSEEAGMLRHYNKHADRFLTGDRWIGAYGAIALPQLHECVKQLIASPFTRRAVVSMGELTPQDINRPACWSFLHLLLGPNGLDLHVYQRSLSMDVMPYDCALLCTVLRWASLEANLALGALRWTVGSLHSTRTLRGVYPNASSELYIAQNVLNSPELCTEELINGLE